MFVIYVLFFFFFNDTATTEIYTYLHTLSLHDALPIFLAALAPVSMLAVVPSGWYPFGPVKWLVVSVLVAAGSAVVLRTGEVHLPRSIRVAVTMLLAALAVGAVVGLAPLSAWIGPPERRFGFGNWCLFPAALAAGSPPLSPTASGHIRSTP